MSDNYWGITDLFNQDWPITYVDKKSTFNKDTMCTLTQLDHINQWVNLLQKLLNEFIMDDHKDYQNKFFMLKHIVRLSSQFLPDPLWPVDWRYYDNCTELTNNIKRINTYNQSIFSKSWKNIKEINKDHIDDLISVYVTFMDKVFALIPSDFEHQSMLYHFIQSFDTFFDATLLFTPLMSPLARNKDWFIDDLKNKYKEHFSNVYSIKRSNQEYVSIINESLNRSFSYSYPDKNDRNELVIKNWKSTFKEMIDRLQTLYNSW